MKWPLLLASLLTFTPATPAQPDGYVEVKDVRHVPGDRIGCRAEDGVYDATKLNRLREGPDCEAARGIAIDFSREALFHWSAASDCHMRVVVKVFRVDAEQKYVVVLNNIYGGCRAGGRRNGFLAFERPPEGDAIEFRPVRVDHIHRTEPSEFVFTESRDEP